MKQRHCLSYAKKPETNMIIRIEFDAIGVNVIDRQVATPAFACVTFERAAVAR